MTHQPFFIPSLLITLFAIPLVLGVIPRNRWYGIRTPQTISDEYIWRRSNRFAGAAFLFSGILYLIVAELFPTPRDPASGLALWALHFLAFTLPLAASVLLTLKFVKAPPIPRT